MQPLQEDDEERPGKITKGLLLPHLKDSLHDQVHADWDRLRVVTGPNGIGKSGTTAVLAVLIAKLLGREFNARTQFHWTGARYKAACEQLLPGDSVTLDESVDAATNYKFMSKGNTSFADYIYTNRHRRLSQWLIHPDVHTLSPIIMDGRAWEEWRVVRRFRDHTVVNVRQLRDQHKVFDSPKHLFSTTIPAPKGPWWSEIRRLKADFTARQADGTTADADIYQSVVERMTRDLGVFDVAA